MWICLFSIQISVMHLHSRTAVWHSCGKISSDHFSWETTFFFLMILFRILNPNFINLVVFSSYFNIF